MTERADSASRQVQELVSQLAASEARLAAIIEHSADAFVVLDAHGMIQFVNQAAVTLFGVDQSKLIGQPFGFPVLTGDKTDIDIFKQHGEIQIAEMRIVDADWAGRKAQVAVLRDITEHSRAEQELRESEKRLALAIEVANLGFWDVDLRTGRTLGNDKLFANLGYLPGDIGPHAAAWSELVHPDDLPLVRQALEDHLLAKTSAFSIECRVSRKSKAWCWVRSQGEVVERDQNQAPLRMIGVSEDINERKEMEERIRHASLHDSLTGLPNRALLYEFSHRMLASAKRGGSRMAFLFIDLDRFKPINDIYGHDAGDAVLCEVAQRLAGCVRGEDLVGRLGGDEFLAVLSHINNETYAAKAAHKAMSCLSLPYRVHGAELNVLPSLGISMYPQDGQSVEELIKNADTAMYHAKERGRNRFQFFKPAFHQQATEALRIEHGLRKGMDEGEFVLYYQPVIDTETHAVAGAEALLRWPAMNAGPAQFIPVAERAGYMQPLGEWVLEEVCRQQQDWRSQGLPVFPVAVNVSPVQFSQKNFVRNVSDTLAAAHVCAEYLRIEVTESMVMKNVDETANVLHALREMGVKVALDDFGTGYSSLSYLGQLPIDILKLDQSFIRGIGSSKASTAIIDGIIALGTSLGLEIIAEGIELEEAVTFLKTRHCKYGQGFLFCHPIPATEFRRWYANYQGAYVH
jgi:diguanylate cyclase (GGDEF)-like protein/PAS domain S-box-containing protein